MLNMVRHEATREHYKQTAIYVAYYTCGSLLPVWLGIMVILLLSKPLELGTFLDSGQFAIYAAAALGASLYLLKRQNSGNESHLFLLVTIVCLVLSAAMYVALTVVDALTLVHLEVNIPLLRILSLVLYVVSLLMTFYLELYQNVDHARAYQARRSRDQKDMESEFEREMNALGQ